MKGWISLHRSVEDNPVLTKGKAYSRYEAWLWLLLRVNHKPAKVLIGNEMVQVGVGETISSLKKLQAQFNWGSTKVRNFCKLLQNEGMLVVKTTQSYTHFHVCNFEKYQKMQHTNNTRTTHSQQTNKKQTNTNNNDRIITNNDNNVNKRKEKFINEVLAEGLKHTPMLDPSTIEAFTDYWTEMNRSKTKMKFELQQTFEISRRLKTWIKNDFSSDKKEPTKKKQFKYSSTYKHYVGYCGNPDCKDYGKSNFYDIWKVDKGLEETRCCGTELLAERDGIQIQDINAEA